jgi:Tol biopolymer transport system component/DNA-binding winged helix-turn-helix (wHTH) protein
MNEPADRIYEFGPFRLDTAERLLLRDGQPIGLTPKAFETLQVLVQSSGRVVRKNDLMTQVWPDAVVEEANLARHVWALRKALGDDNTRPAYIETVSKLGYRFVAPVTELPLAINGRRADLAALVDRPAPVEHVGAAPEPTRRAWPLLAGLLVLTIAAVAAAAVARYWRAAPPAATNRSGFAFLTDGSTDDSGAYWTNDGRIYFSRSVTNTRVETWTMDGDGTNQRRANTSIAGLLNGRWSPDGQKVVFVRENDPASVFLANADGTGEIRMPFVAGNFDWSPDSTRFVYQARVSAEHSEIYVYTLENGTSTSLTGGIASADPSFSPDGTQIAFTSWRDGNAEIYVMDSDGANVRRLTNHPAFDNYPVFSPDGTQIAFQSNREDEHVEIYLQHLNDDSPPYRLTRSSGVTGLAAKCWSADGTQMLVYTNPNGRHQIALIDVDPIPAELLLADDAAELTSPRLSRDGKRMLHEARLSDRRLEVRVTDLATKQITRVFSTEPDYPVNFRLAPAWSPDNALVAFSVRLDGNSEIVVVRADGTDRRNLTRNALLDGSPVFSPDGREIVFARDAYGQAQLYRMDLDGGNQRRVTDKTGWEMGPAFSAATGHLAFAGDRDSRGLDILVVDPDRPHEERRPAARRSQDTSPAFSHDGRQLAFVATSDGNPEIYVMNADGTGLFRLTHSAADEASPHFASDGRILFSSNRTGKFAIYQVRR